MRKSCWSCAAVVLGLLLVSAPASAEPATANSIQLGLGFRYGFEMNEGDFNPWGTGLGIEGGYTLPNAVYVGGVFDYFFGETLEGPGVEISGNVWQLMAEGGYDLGLGGLFVIRPKLGLGIANASAETCLDRLGCESASETDFAIAPGATFIFLPPSFVLSLDLRYPVIFAENESLEALVFAVGIGF